MWNRVTGKLVWAVVGVAMLGLLASCIPASTPSPAASTKPASSSPTSAPTQSAPAAKAPTAVPTLAPLNPPANVRVAVYGSIGDGAIYIAQDMGYFTALGLKVEMSVFGTTAESIPLLGSDKMDVTRGVGSAGLFNATLRGIPLRIVSDSGRTYKGSGYIAVVLQKGLIDSGQVKDYSDLKGLKFAVAGTSTGSLFERAMFAALSKGNLSPKDVTQTNMSMADAMTAMGNKNIDGAMLSEPMVTQGVNQGLFVRWKGLDDLLLDEQHTWMVYSPTFGQNSPEAARRFMIAYLQGVRDFMAAINTGKNKQQIVSILTKYTSVKDAALYDKMVYPAFDPNGAIDKGSISRMVEWNTAQGYITGKIDVDSMIDGQYLSAALKQVGESK